MLAFDPALELRFIKTVLDVRAPALLATLNSPGWFGLPQIQEIAARAANLRKAGKEIPSSQALASDPVLTAEAKALLAGDMQPFLPHEVDTALAQVNHYRQGRLLFQMCSQVTEKLRDTVATTEQMEEAKRTIETTLGQLTHADLSEDMLTYGTDNETTLELYEQSLKQDGETRFIKTGFQTMDNKQGGLGRGRIYTLGAPSGQGKSLMGNQIAINAYLHRHSVGYFSFELGKVECMYRTQANISRIPHDRFQLNCLSADDRRISDRALAKFLSHGEIHGVRLDYHCPSADMTIADVFAFCEPLGYDLWVIDYINLLKFLDPKKGQWENIGEAFRLAKMFARKTNSTGILLVQTDEETNAVKYAKSIIHHSDGVYLWKLDDKAREQGLVEIKQVKLRNFAPTTFHLKAEPEYCAFTDSYGTGAVSGQAPQDTLKRMSL